MKTFKNTRLNLDDLPEWTVIAFKIGTSCPEGYKACDASEIEKYGAIKLWSACGYACYGWL